MASYANGLGNVPWQQGELFGLEVRGIGTSLSTAITNWGGNLLIGFDLPVASGKDHPRWCLRCLGWFFVLGCFPETAGLSLEKVKRVFKTRLGIKESQRLRHTKAEIREV
ncbi:hypothetical protein BYT27DRAFT_7210439 [Phlegmacium glaucopus]|nr:hypothetical protein BYT27DRAFT_7210439 [Phlegmacium glaucopus]